MRRIGWIVTALAVLGAASLFAAGGAESKATTRKVNARGVFPIVNEKVTLKVFFVQDPLITDYEDNYHTKWLEEKTGIHVEWMLTPSQQQLEKLNLLLASGTDLPDVIMRAVPNTTLLKYGQQGILLPLNDYVRDYADEFNKIANDLKKANNVDLQSAYTAPDGKIYGLPNVNTCRWCETIWRNWVDTRWMTKLGLKIPNTVDEFVAMLKAFKTKDPNGNGKADEIPLMGARTGWGAQVEGYLMMPFIVYNAQGTRLILDKATGKVTPAYTQPAYLDGIKFIRSLVTDGLLDPVSLTQTSQEYQVMGEADPVIVGDHLGSNFPWLTLKDEKYRSMEAIPPLNSPVTGKKQTYANGYQALGDAVFMITKSCKNPEAAFRWADFQYSYDNSMLARYAKKGTDWVAAEPGTKGPFGDPAVFREVSQWGAPTKNSLRQMFMYLSYDLLNGLQMTDSKGVSVNSDAHYVLRTPLYMDVGVSNTVPRVYILPAEVDQYGELSTNLSTYVAESFARFVSGDKPLAEWDAFQAELKKIGVDKFIQMTETAYKRQYMVAK